MKLILFFLFLILLSAAANAEWSEPVNISGLNQVEGIVSFALGSDGSIHAVYTTGASSMYYQKSSDSGVTWSSPASMPKFRNVSISSLKVALDSGNNPHVIWYETNGSGPVETYEVFYSNSTDGTSWLSPVNVSRSPLNLSFRPDIFIDESDVIHVVWEDIIGLAPTNYEILYSQSSDRGFTWSTPVNASNTINDSIWPSVRVHDGMVHVMWEERNDYPSIAYDIYHSNSSDGVNWGPNINVSKTPTTYSNYVNFEINSTGGLHAVWLEGFTSDPNISYSGSADGVTWSEPVNISGYMETNGTSQGFLPQITIDGNDNLHVVFQSGSVISIFPYYDIMYVNSTGGVWSGQFNISENFAGGLWWPDIAVNSTGGIIILFSGRFDLDDFTYIFFTYNYHNATPQEGGLSFSAPEDYASILLMFFISVMICIKYASTRVEARAGKPRRKC